MIVGVRSDALPLGDPYPAGVTTITWTATDECGNESVCVQTITVSDVNELVLVVDLSPTVDTTLTRCITFELWECPATIPTEIVSLELTFTDGMFSGTVELPCGNYTCITARDELHTLRRTATLSIAGSEPAQYVADFSSTSGNDLIGGNLNDDLFVDILDFGVFVGQFGADYGTGDTTCATPFPHADISGNGTVGVEDFTFISINFLESSEANCCGAQGAQGRPVKRISVRQLKRMRLGDLVVGDLNHDGWLDIQDMVEFFNGRRP